MAEEGEIVKNLPSWDEIRHRLAEIARERMVLKSLLRTVNNRDRHRELAEKEQAEKDQGEHNG